MVLPERTIVDRLEFHMSVPTPYCFMRRFLEAAKSDKKLGLVDYRMLKFQPSMLAAAAIFTCQFTIKWVQVMEQMLQLHTMYCHTLSVGVLGILLVGFFLLVPDGGYSSLSS